MQGHSLNQIVANNMFQHGFAVNDDLLAVPPVIHCDIDDGHGATGPLVLIGFLAEKAVYRTTHTVAHYMEGNLPGDYRIHWPPLFPNIWIPECDYLQLDVTIRGHFESEAPLVEWYEDYHDEHEPLIFYNNPADIIHAYDNDNIYAWENNQQQQQLEQPDINVAETNDEWFQVNSIDDEWFPVDSIDDFNFIRGKF